MGATDRISSRGKKKRFCFFLGKRGRTRIKGRKKGNGSKTIVASFGSRGKGLSLPQRANSIIEENLEWQWLAST